VYWPPHGAEKREITQEACIYSCSVHMTLGNEVIFSTELDM